VRVVKRTSDVLWKTLLEEEINTPTSCMRCTLLLDEFDGDEKDRLCVHFSVITYVIGHSSLTLFFPPPSPPKYRDDERYTTDMIVTVCHTPLDLQSLRPNTPRVGEA